MIKLIIKSQQYLKQTQTIAQKQIKQCYNYKNCKQLQDLSSKLVYNLANQKNKEKFAKPQPVRDQNEQSFQNQELNLQFPSTQFLKEKILNEQEQNIFEDEDSKNSIEASIEEELKNDISEGDSEIDTVDEDEEEIFSQRKQIKQDILKNSKISIDKLQLRQRETQGKQTQYQQPIEQDEQQQQDKKKRPSGEPQWMKFFSFSEPMKVDIERSVKSENNDLIQNYIKSSYNQFNLEQLVICLQKLQRSQILSKILGEIKNRIILQKEASNFQIDFMLLKNSFETVMQDRFFQKYLSVQFSKNFEMYDIDQQTDIIKYLLIVNKITPKLIIKYLKFFQSDLCKDKQKLKVYLEEMQPEQLSYHMNVLVFLSKYISPAKFNEMIPSEVISMFFDQQCKNLHDSFSQPSLNKYVEMEKLVPQELSYFYTLEQKQKIKCLIAEKLKMRFNIQETKGRFLPHKKDKTVSRFIRNIFESTDRFILEEVLVLFGNYLLVKDIKADFKFDFKLFSYLDRFNFAYKLYLDEALWPTKSLTKAFMNSLKKQNFIDHALGFIIFHKINIYLSLNYDAIVKQDQLEYRKNTWNKIIQDNIYNLEEYILQISSSNLLEKVVDIPEKALREKQEREKQERLLQEQSENKTEDDKLAKEDASKKQVQEKYDLDDFEYENPAAEEDDDGDSEFSSFSAQSQNEQKDFDDSKIKQNQDLERERLARYQEYDAYISQQKFVELNIFQKKISATSTLPLKYYINLLQTISRILFNFKNMTNSFYKILQDFFDKENHTEIFNHFCMIPGLLESLSLLTNYSNANPHFDWFPVNLQSQITLAKKEIDDIFNKNQGNGVKILQYLESKGQNLHESSWEKDKAYDKELMFKEIQNHSFFSRKEDFQNKLELLQQSEQDIGQESFIKLNYKRDLLDERFIYSEENIIKKVLNSEALKYIINESQFKRIVDRNLKQTKYGKKYIKNFVSYPCIADFFLPDYSVVIQVIDQRKLLGGVEGVMSGYYHECEQFFQNMGHRVVYIDLKDYDVSEVDFQAKIVELINEEPQQK